jgi:hypothetical protein
MKEDYAIWTIAPNERARAAAGELAASMEEVGLFKALHVWARAPVAGATTHSLEDYEPGGGWYRLGLLPKAAEKIKAKYLLWLDPITKFERHPGSVLTALHGAPLHVPLTFSFADPDHAPAEWHGCPCGEMVRLMRAAGIRNKAIYAASANFFIVHRESIETVTELAFDFARRADAEGWRLPVEPLLAYAMQMLCGDATRHRAGDRRPPCGVTVPE